MTAKKRTKGTKKESKKSSKKSRKSSEKASSKEAAAQKSQPAKPQTLGTKYTCYKCGTKFYDLGRPEPICPKCGANQKDAPITVLTKSGTKKLRKTKRVKPQPIDEIIDIIEQREEKDAYLDDEFGYEEDMGLGTDEDEEEEY